MKLIAVHTVPVWEEHGAYTYGLVERDDAPDPVAWANLLLIELEGEQHILLATDGDS